MVEKRSVGASSSTSTRTPGTRPSPRPTGSGPPVSSPPRFAGRNSTTSTSRTSRWTGLATATAASATSLPESTTPRGGSTAPGVDGEGRGAGDRRRPMAPDVPQDARRASSGATVEAAHGGLSRSGSRAMATAQAGGCRVSAEAPIAQAGIRLRQLSSDTTSFRSSRTLRPVRSHTAANISSSSLCHRARRNASRPVMFRSNALELLDDRSEKTQFLLEVADRAPSPPPPTPSPIPHRRSRNSSPPSSRRPVSSCWSGGAGCALTAAGQVLVDHARRVLDAVEQAEAAVALTGDEVAGTVKVGGYASVASNLVPPAFDLLMRKHPGIDLYFEHMAEDQCCASSEAGDHRHRGRAGVLAHAQASGTGPRPERLDVGPHLSGPPRHLDADPLGAEGWLRLPGCTGRRGATKRQESAGVPPSNSAAPPGSSPTSATRPTTAS